MICPACKNPMIVVEYEKIELDHCTNCSGVWFDAGEVELLLEAAGREGSHLSVAEVLASPEAASTEAKRKCPVCGDRMKKTEIAHEPKVLIDACTKGDGLWFDGDEVNQLIAQCADKPCQASESRKRIIAFLGDTFKFTGRPQ